MSCEELVRVHVGCIKRIMAFAVLSMITNILLENASESFSVDVRNLKCNQDGMQTHLVDTSP